MEEIELTFLAKSIPEGVEQAPSVEMLDIYLPRTAPHPKLRIRRRGKRYEITKKRLLDESDASHQIEETIAITPDEFNELSQIPGKRVMKRRFLYQENGITYEVDVFEGDLKGLVVVDVEFDSLAKKEKFQAPQWCLADVTQEEFIAGGMLCGKKYEDLETDLARFNYEKIL